MEKVPEKNLISRYGEYGRIIGFQVINSEMPEEQQLLSFDGLTKATFTLHKPDGNLYIEDLDITTYSEDNVAVIALNEQMTAAEGKAHYDITLTYEDAEDGFRIITAHGNMLIDTPMAGTEEINSTSVIYGLIFPDDFQLKLTAGANITISEDNVISSTGGGGGGGEYIAGEGIRISGETISLTTQVLNQLSQIAGKQAKLTAGANININSSNVISATDTTYTAGSGISISGGVISNTSPGITYTAGDNISIEGTEISATDTTYTAGANVSISDANVISATDTTYTAGSNVQISGENVISATDTTYSAGTGLDLTGSAFELDSATQSALASISGKQDALIAGSNISLTGNVISATDTTYTAGTNISITGTTISATDTTYTAGSGIAISAENVISATGGGGGGLIAGTGIDITGDTISLDSSTQSTLADVADKQDALTAGSNITISGTTISATDTTYTAGANVQISDSNVITATNTTYSAGTGLELSSGAFSLSTATQNSLAKTANIGAPDTYDPDHEYNLGEACEHDGLWYRSLYGYSGMGPGPWDATKWERTDSWTEIDDLNQNLAECVKKKTTADITVPTATGRTIAQALNVLVNSSDYDISKVTPFSYIKNGVVFYRVSSITSNRVVFTYEAVGASVPTIISLYAQVGNNLAYSYNGTTVTAVGGETLSSALEFYY